MKNFFLKSLIIITAFSALYACSKTGSPLNITLYNKPLPVIQSYINGTWQLRYENGGFTSGTYPTTDTELFTFNNDRIKIVSNSSLFVDTTINWIWSEGIYTSGDSTFVMNYSTNNGLPVYFIVKEIYNDTLILYDDAVDGMTYHFTKSK